MATNQRTITLRCDIGPNQLKFCPDGSYLAVGFPRGDVLVVFLDPENLGKGLEFFRSLYPNDCITDFGSRKTSLKWISNEALLINDKTYRITRGVNPLIIDTYNSHNTYGVKGGLYISKDPFRVFEPRGPYINAKKELRATNTICEVEAMEGDIKIAFYENNLQSKREGLYNKLKVESLEGVYAPQDLETEL